MKATPACTTLRNSTNPLGGLKLDTGNHPDLDAVLLRNSTNPLGGLKRLPSHATGHRVVLRNSTNPLGGLKRGAGERSARS